MRRVRILLLLSLLVAGLLGQATAVSADPGDGNPPGKVPATTPDDPGFGT